MTDTEIATKNALADSHNPLGSNPNASYTVAQTGTGPAQNTGVAGNNNPYAYSYGTSQNPYNPVTSSTGTRTGINTIGSDIAGLTGASASNTKLLNDRMTTLENQKESAIASIKKDYEQASTAQANRQNQDYAGRATGLITSGGGFLGATQSQQGVLQNLKATFEGEKNALMAKRDAAIQQAQNAYDDKQFALAQSLVAEAKSTEQELYNRQKDYADQQLAIARENRSQTEFDMGIADKKIDSYAQMSDADFAKVSLSDIAALDKNYYSGYTANARLIKQKAETVKTNKDAVALDSDILDMRLKIPAGQKFVLGGKTYTGLKVKETSGGGGTDAQKFQSTLNYFRQNIFVPGMTIMGSDSVPFLQKSYLEDPINPKYIATAEGWREAMRISGMKRQDFIDEFKQYLNTDTPEYLKAYGLDGGEIKRITGVEPIVGT